MTATVKKVDPTQVELEIAVPRDEVAAAQDRAFRKLVKNARIPGFRPGKAPRKIFEQQYGSQIIAERAMEDLVPDAYARAVREHNLEPVDRPQMELLPEEEGQPLRFRATVAVRPEIELKEYKGITLREQPESASDEDVERSVDALRREQATLVPVERPVQMGDFPTLDYVGKIDGVAFEGGSAENQPTEISVDRFIPGFAEGIVGMQAGETKEIEARFPEDYPNRELAGKTAVFTVTVRDVKERELPPLDDAFAARLAKDATLLSLKTDLRARLDAAAKSRARRALSNELLDRLLELHDFPLPTVLVDREVDALIDERKSYVVRFGRSWDEYLSSLGLNETSLREEMRTEAERRVRVTLLLEAIAKAEGIKATPADVEAEVTSLSQQYGQPREKILAALQPTMGSFIEGIVRAKTLDTLLEVAKIEAAPVAGAEGGDAGSGATNAGSP